MSDWEALKATVIFILESFGDLFDWCVAKLKDFAIFTLLFIVACFALGLFMVLVS